MKFTLLILTIFLFLGMRNTPIYSVKLKMSNIRNADGRIQLQFYKDEKTFKAETPYKQIYIPKANIKNHYLEYTIQLEEGVWGLALLDDENSNGKMDYTILPKEGFAFGNYYHTGWSRPKFDDFKLDIHENTFVTIKFRYV